MSRAALVLMRRSGGNALDVSSEQQQRDKACQSGGGAQFRQNTMEVAIINTARQCKRFEALSLVLIWRFRKIRRAFLGVPIMRIVLRWGLYWGPSQDSGCWDTHLHAGRHLQAQKQFHAALGQDACLKDFGQNKTIHD